MQRITSNILLAIAALSLLSFSGCNRTFRAYEFTLKGTIATTSGEQGKINVELYHKQTGVGTLAQPLLLVDSFQLDKAGEFTKTIEFPIEKERSGLVVYIWHDRDGDGSLCSLTSRDELSGLTDIKDFPKRTVNLTLTLDQKCLGPEALYP